MQSITNTVKSTNPLAGLLGLNPKPTATSNVFGGSMSQSTPALIPQKAPVAAPVAQGNSQSLSSALVPGQFGGATQPPAQVNPQAPVAPLASNNVTPVVGGAGSNGTLNPNNNLQVGTTPAPVNTGTPGLFPSVISSLAGSGVQNTALGANAQKIAADAGQRIADVGSQGQRFIAGQKTTGTTPVAEGNAAITAQTTAAEQAAIAAGANVALQGNAQALTGQAQTQSALSNAGSLSQPSTAAYGQTVFDPVTGQYTGGGGLPADVMQQYAQMAATGQYAGIPAFITSNPVLNAQLNVAAKALNPSYTPVGAAGASNVLGNIPAMQSANTAAEGIKNTISTYLQANPQLNPSDLAAGNLLQQWLQGKQLTDPKYQTLFNYLNEYTNTLAPILGVGGDPTNLKTQMAQGFVNAAASGQSISQVLTAMSQLATNKIQDLQNGAIGGGTSVPATGGSNIQVQASDGNSYGFYQDAQGQWHSQ